MRSIANNFTRLREVNAELVRDALKAVNADTKAGLASATGLSVATCGNILAEMLERDEVIPLELGEPGGGRPPRLYAYNALYALTALVFPKAEAGRKHIVYAVVDAKGGVVERDARQVEDAGLDALDGLIVELAGKHPRLKALAVSVPGLTRNGRVSICDIPELENIELEAHLRERHGLPVAIENDMNLAALGYYDRNRDHDRGPVMYLVVPSKTCTGAGLVVDGKLVRGHSCFAGELSFMPFGVSRARQFAGLKPDEALAYTAKLAAAVIPVVNPSTLVVASGLIDAEALERIRGVCLEHIPEEHMPKLVSRPDIDEDCLAGLALAAASSLSGRVRLVEEDKD